MEPGTRIGRFLVERYVTADSIGERYAATDCLIERAGEVKVMHRSLVATRHDSDRIVARMHELGYATVGRLGDGRVCWVERVDCRDTLRAAIDHGTTLNAAITLLANIAHALDSAHDYGFVHGDLTPDNVCPRGSHVHVEGFGVASLVWTAAPPGGWVGTPAYMAPEQWADGPSAAADRYAFGVIAYELFTGELPLLGPIPEGLARLPPAVEAVLRRARDPEPRVRHASAGDLVHDLRAAFVRTRARSRYA